jgi:sporulation protein YlmC with PRC-barrel domain
MKGTMFASELNHKRVVDTGGREIGRVDHIQVEATMGILTDLVVKATSKIKLSEFKKRRTFIAIPFDAVKAVKDVILVDSEKLKVLGESCAAVEENIDLSDNLDHRKAIVSKAGIRYEML